MNWDQLLAIVAGTVTVYALARIYLACRDRGLAKSLRFEFLILAISVATYVLIVYGHAFRSAPPKIIVRYHVPQTSQPALPS